MHHESSERPVASPLAAQARIPTDEVGREVLAFLPGDVPAELDGSLPDNALTAAARRMGCEARVPIG